MARFVPHPTLFAAFALLALAGCGKDDPEVDLSAYERDASLPDSSFLDSPSDGAEGGAACTDDHSVCLRVQIPTPLDAAPKRLFVGFWTVVPAVTPPVAIAASIDNPAVSAGQLLPVRVGDGGLNGTFHVGVFLYMPGGGTFIPVSGVDYLGYSSAAVELGGAAVNLDETIVLAQ